MYLQHTKTLRARRLQYLLKKMGVYSLYFILVEVISRAVYKIDDVDQNVREVPLRLYIIKESPVYSLLPKLSPFN